jgi:polysaccharide export outer membrane protein
MRDFTARIDAEGFVQLPIIEALKISDRTTRQIQQLLKKKYEIRFLDAWVTVELHNAQSHPVHFLGEFRDPGVRYLERRTDLLEGITMAGGLEEDAYLPGARLIRNERFCSINLRALLRTGDFTQNVSLIGGDLIFVPLRGDMNVYILGAVETPQAIAFGESGRSLLEVLSIAGGPDAGTALLKEVRIIRTLTPTRGELLVLDVRGMLRGERLDFELEPDDVIYVPRSALGSWNEAIRQILPSLQLLSGAIAPVALITTLAE